MQFRYDDDDNDENNNDDIVVIGNGFEKRTTFAILLDVN